MHLTDRVARCRSPARSVTGLWATALHTRRLSARHGAASRCVVYRKLGLRMLRTMWINLDLIWGGALVVTGAVALLA